MGSLLLSLDSVWRSRVLWVRAFPKGVGAPPSAVSSCYPVMFLSVSSSCRELYGDGRCFVIRTFLELKYKGG